jgi:hypothetical protein
MWCFPSYAWLACAVHAKGGSCSSTVGSETPNLKPLLVGQRSGHVQRNSLLARTTVLTSDPAKTLFLSGPAPRGWCCRLVTIEATRRRHTVTQQP